MQQKFKSGLAKVRSLTDSQPFLSTLLEGGRNIGVMLIGGSVLGGFFSNQFSKLVAVGGIALGLAFMALAAFGVAMLESTKTNPPDKGGDSQ